VGIDKNTGPIIAIRMRQFGDVLATLGALAALKRRWPGRRLVYVVDRHFHSVLQPLTFIDELLDSPRFGGYLRYLARIRSMSPGAVIDFHGNSRSAFLTWLSGAPVRIGWHVRGRRHAYTVAEPRADVVDGRVRPRTSLESAMRLVRHLGVEETGSLADLPVDPAAVHRARGRLNRSGVPVRALEAGRVVALNPGRPYPAKAWPQERFVSLARELVALGHTVVITWGPGEREAAAAIAAESGDGVGVAPETRIDELPGLLKSVGAVVTIDSGLKHLAVAVGVPTVTLFGSTDPREWHMGREHDQVLWRGLSCSPCRRLTCPFGAPCMDIAVGEVMAAIRHIQEVGA
jgi:ADP-heptose:LPS heptosyltransferase